MIKYMLSILMDNIKDADMMIDYAQEARDAGEDECYSWFKTHAKTRVDATNNDYAFISQHINLTERIREGDEMAEALASHLNYEMQNLNRKMSMI